MTAGYVELRARSAMSFGDGATAPEALAGRAAELGYDALALCDAADLGGIIRFALAAAGAGAVPRDGGAPPARVRRAPPVAAGGATEGCLVRGAAA